MGNFDKMKKPPDESRGHPRTGDPGMIQTGEIRPVRRPAGFAKEIVLKSSGLVSPVVACLAFCAMAGLVIAMAGCGSAGSSSRRSPSLTVLHAGSLSLPFKQMAAAFREENPRVEVRLEAHGSRTCARHISELGREVDVFGSADSEVIQNLLFPQHASFVIEFATNEMVIAYTDRSRRHQDIFQDNWYRTLLEEGVEFGHSDPHADPCGYRAVLTMKLSEKHYGEEGLYQRLADKMPRRNIRPKEVDLLALLETGELDYIFIYRSVARQHGLKILSLPPQINLSSPEYALFYQSVSIRITGKTPREEIVRVGAPMVYGLTIPHNSPNRELAVAFVNFVLSPRGREIMEAGGQPVLDPPRVVNPGRLPPGISLPAGDE